MSKSIYEQTLAAIKELIQCCEHLNRAIITERRAVPIAEPVNVIPQPKAGGSLATKAYAEFDDPMVLAALSINNSDIYEKYLKFFVN